MVIDDLVAAVAAEDTVIDSAVVYIQGVPALIKTAVDAALVGGATAAELAPLTTLISDTTTKAAALTKAMTDNTPTPPVATAKKP